MYTVDYGGLSPLLLRKMQYFRSYSYTRGDRKAPIYNAKIPYAHPGFNVTRVLSMRTQHPGYNFVILIPYAKKYNCTEN